VRKERKKERKKEEGREGRRREGGRKEGKESTIFHLRDGLYERPKDFFIWKEHYVSLFFFLEVLFKLKLKLNMGTN
jgi:hypothetical protein